ncbi:CoA pyrophosphatase [Sphingomonas sp. HDW15A]|uniref:CoA pyrophosphatase n=1 Tax=Sphingomonas sp. HDW15A TaxID=2714942 RepID=UPI00140BEE50|nr:CoA pyrophosphatase [Sphingomonas sp. HDW15A]QIK96314.1 CoA pyrophosphatase [Sphingomonas sp. HDW15A]
MKILDRLVEGLGRPAPHNLQSEDLEGQPDPRHEAAVLVAVTKRPDPGLILTVRREHLRAHAGQIAFPGGRLDPGEDHVAAALREAEEEIALSPSEVRVIGRADPYRTITGYLVVPIVGLISPDLDLAPHEDEVADLFEAPLSFLLDTANHRRMSAEFQGKTRQYWQIDWQDRRIWGATAAMIVNLARRLEIA